MQQLKITDTPRFEEFVPLENFYPSPAEIQETSISVYKSILPQQLKVDSFEGIFKTMINRFLFVEVKLGEFCLLSKKLNKHINENSIKEVHLYLSKANRELGSFLVSSLKKEGIHVFVQHHSYPEFWKSSLSKSIKADSIAFIQRHLILLAQLIALTCNYFFRWRATFSPQSTLLHWSGFANNRETVDFALLDNLESNGIQVFHPDPIRLRRKGWFRSIYFLGKYSPSPWAFFKHSLRTLFLRKKIVQQLKSYEKALGPIPNGYSQVCLLKVAKHLTHNFLQAKMLEALYNDPGLKVCSVFRGGAAAGLVFSGILKEELQNKNARSILVPHGTEFRPIDHFSYFYTDFNVLPSKKIKDRWELELKSKHSDILKYNKSQLVAGGRIDYEYLKINVKKLQKSKSGKFKIGLPLTYNTQAFNRQIIVDVISAFDSTFADKFEVHVKARPNLSENPNYYLGAGQETHIYKKDIYSFLSDMDFIIGSASTYGVLTMVVSDAIFLDIPAIYYLPQKGLTAESLGYSYSDTMNSFAFYNSNSLCDFLSKFDSLEMLKESVISLNKETKAEILFQESPTETLKNLFNY